MKEGWHGDNYLLLLDPSEVAAATNSYRLDKFLPGFSVIGILNWDDLIVRDANNTIFSVPTVPLSPEHLHRIAFQLPTTALVSDLRFVDRVKWYIKPILFGGDPSATDNISWVSHHEHSKLVVWWNDQYHSLKS
jgi:hypothetical protein